MVRTSGSHPGNRGSIPLGTAKQKGVCECRVLFDLYSQLGESNKRRARCEEERSDSAQSSDDKRDQEGAFSGSVRATSGAVKALRGEIPLGTAYKKLYQFGRVFSLGFNGLESCYYFRASASSR